MTRLKHHILLALLLFFTLSAYAGKPHIINIARDTYNAANKNWSIGQDEKGFMYFANDIGLLEFDGIEWTLNKLPNSLIARSVAVLSHNTIFTGSFEEFGRWDRDISGDLVYTSLSSDIDKKLFKNDDFWKVWISDNKVYFQSFTSIYVYDYNTVKQIPSDHGFLFLSKVRDEFLVQQIVGPLQTLKGDALQKIEGSDFFSDTDVRVILPYLDNKYLIGTSTMGVYIYDGKMFSEWSHTLSALMNAKELNCGILSSKGVYYFGTILDGIYVVNTKGEVIDHISSKGTLQNNTIHALYEDNLNNVWAALDRGISYVQYVDNISYHIDTEGRIGAVYDVIIWDNKFFIATNQGVFYIPTASIQEPDVFEKMVFIDGTQGQSWGLKIIDDNLYCCHNKGFKKIDRKLNVSDSYNIGTGVYNVSELSFKGRSLLVLSTYTSLKIIDKNNPHVSLFDSFSEPVTNTIIDHLNNAWLELFNRGISRTRLNDDLSDFQSIYSYSSTKDESLPYKMRIFKVRERIGILGDSRFYLYNAINDSIVADSKLNECFKNINDIKHIIHIGENNFWALSNTVIYKFFYDGYEADILESYNLGANISLVNQYENAYVVNDSICIFCLDNGFLFYQRERENPVSKQLFNQIPYIRSIRSTNANGVEECKDLSVISEVPYTFNTISFRFSGKDAFPLDLSFQYKLENVDNEWSAIQKTNEVQYERLPDGKYTFMVRSVDNLGNFSEPAFYSFVILPPWYQTWWAYISYVILVLITLYIVWVLILRRYRNLHLQKIRNRETQRLRTLAGELREEIEVKNAEVVTQTSFIIKKNELIMKIREVIDDFYSKNDSKAATSLHQKITALLNSVDTEEDWKTFLIKFEQKHTSFFKRLKVMYPQLTSNDLRLCACIKLNLDIKETASLMNLSVRAIENNRYRLRKKLNLQPSDNLYDFFINID